MFGQWGNDFFQLCKNSHLYIQYAKPLEYYNQNIYLICSVQKNIFRKLFKVGRSAGKTAEGAPAVYQDARDQRQYCSSSALNFTGKRLLPTELHSTLEIRGKTRTQAQIYDGAMYFAQEVLEFCSPQLHNNFIIKY